MKNANITVQVALGGPLAPVKAMASSVVLDAVAGTAIARAEDTVSRTVFAAMADRPWDDNAPEGSQQAKLQAGAKLIANLAVSAVTGKAIGKVAGKAAGTVPGGASAKGPGGLCFVAGTPVLTTAGYRAIESLAVGDTVVSRDEVSGRTLVKPVTRLYRNEDRAVLDVVLDDGHRTEVLGATAEHPFFVADRGWVAAGSLVPGDRIVGRASGEGRGGVLLVKAVNARPDVAETYNLEIGDTHTYFVGLLEAWIHNQCKVENTSKIKWVDENATMGPEARKFDNGAHGSRSGVATRLREVPNITRTLTYGSKAVVKFDGFDGDVLIDRKRSIVTSQKVKDQALRQSQALEENDFTGRWEVPNTSQAARVIKMLNGLGIKNITVKVVDHD